MGDPLWVIMGRAAAKKASSERVIVEVSCGGFGLWLAIPGLSWVGQSLFLYWGSYQNWFSEKSGLHTRFRSWLPLGPRLNSQRIWPGDYTKARK